MEQTPRNTRYQTLDAWRGLACLLVIVFHSNLYATDHISFSKSDPATWFVTIAERFSVGVPMFFVISGYCIAATADSSRRRGHSLATYAARRFRRIFPPYWACLALYVPVVAFVEWQWPGTLTDAHSPQRAPWDLSGLDWFGTVTLTEGWLYHFHDGSRDFFLGHAWTLGYEEQFYAVTGLLLLLSRKWFFPAAAVVTLGVALVAPLSPRGFFFDGSWLQFAAGMGVFYSVVYGSLRARLVIGAIILAAFIWVCRDLEPMALGRRLDFPAAYGFAILLLVLHPFDASIAQSRVLVPLTFCGQMCYSLYLMHWPLSKMISGYLWRAGFTSPADTMLVTVPVCLVASLIAGRVFYHFVERRFLNSPSTSSPPSALGS